MIKQEYFSCETMEGLLSVIADWLVSNRLAGRVQDGDLNDIVFNYHEVRWLAVLYWFDRLGGGCF